MAKQKAQAAGKKGDWRTVNRVQLSALMGVHQDSITRFAREGMPVQVRGGAGKEGAYDAVECLDWWREHYGKNAKDAAQTRALEASAALNELKLREQSREALPRDVVVSVCRSAMAGWSAMLRAIPRQARQSGVIATPEGEANLRTLVSRILDEIANWKDPADAKRSAQRATAA